MTGPEAQRQRLRRIATVVTGIIIALAADDLPAADLLIASLDPADLPDAILELAAIPVGTLLKAGYTREQIRAEFANLALKRALDDAGGPPQ